MAREGVPAAPSRCPSPARLRGPSLAPPQLLGPEPLQLSSVYIAPELLPCEQLSDCFRSVLTLPGLHTFSDSQGYPALRGVIAERLRGRGIDASPEDVIITAGSQQALDMVGRTLAQPVVAMEDPVYSIGRQLFSHLGCRLVPLPLDPFRGVDLDRWAETLAAARPGLVYLISSYQNPTGYSYSSAELERLLELCGRAWIRGRVRCRAAPRRDG